jgi:hypothetical protein
VITFRIRKEKLKKFLHKAAASSSSSSSATKVLQWQLETLRLQCAKTVLLTNKPMSCCDNDH